MTKTNKAPDTVALPKAANGHGGARPKAGRKPETVADASGESKIVYYKARAKKETHHAVKAELEEKLLRSQLVEVEKVTEQADAAARAVRDAFLALPDRLASLLVGRTEKQIAMELRKEIRQTLANASIKISGGY
jgi:hypothetical protein